MIPVDCGFRRVIFEGDGEKLLKQIQNDRS